MRAVVRTRANFITDGQALVDALQRRFHRDKDPRGSAELLLRVSLLQVQRAAAPKPLEEDIIGWIQSKIEEVETGATPETNPALAIADVPAASQAP